MIGNKSEEEIFRHQRFLNHFFKIISLHPALKNSWFLEKFLRETDLQVFKNIKKKVKNLQKPQSVEEIENFEGKIGCIGQKDKNFIDLITEYISLSQPLLKKIKNLHKELEENLKTSSKTL